MTPKPLKIAEIILLIVVITGGVVWFVKKISKTSEQNFAPNLCQNTAMPWPKDGDVINEYGGARISFCLDIAKYPLENIKITCSDYTHFGYVSNLSVNGPDSYPIGYEIGGDGTCTWQNGDYKVTITNRNN